MTTSSEFTTSPPSLQGSRDPLDIEDTIGNPLFAIKTCLSSLLLRIQAGRTEEAAEIVESIRRSVEKAKVALSAAASATKTQTRGF